MVFKRFALVLSVFVLVVVGLVGAKPTSIQAQASSTDANKKLVEAFVAVLNSHDLGGLDALTGPGFLEHNPFVQDAPPGLDAFKGTAQAILAAFPDVKITIQLEMAEKDLVATRHTVTATNKGPFNGVPATGKKVTWTENHIYRIKDGKIVEHWAEANVIGILIQIGALPAPGAAPTAAATAAS